MTPTTQEHTRLEQDRLGIIPWKKWGPYLSERQWGTVREDYSNTGDPWNYFTHDQARSRAYRWGEDGLAGICDDKQILCFALALWNRKDPILKERAFGLTNSEGNHGEDCKEYYFYLDSTPTHSYMKYLYKYPHRAYPYADIVTTNKTRGRDQPEYELIDTGIFDDNRYFDIFAEFAKNFAEDMLVRIIVHNRGPETAHLHLLPTLWFRNTWSWVPGGGFKPELVALESAGYAAVEASHPALGRYYLICDNADLLLFTENETNNQRIFGGRNASRYVKDGINDYIVSGQVSAVNPERRGTKVAAHYGLEVPAQGSVTVRLRLTTDAPRSFAKSAGLEAQDFDSIVETRHKEADEFYETVISQSTSEDERSVMRQALAGMLWTKQHYIYDVYDWVREDVKREPRNKGWVHLCSADIISMPDKWEYPWFAAWDLAFHTIALQIVDPAFAKCQLELIQKPWFMHANGQIPAYEWNFGDVNPPVQGLAAWRIYTNERVATGKGDTAFLRRTFEKLMMNFTWWVNRKDRLDNNLFEGGFLGLDNIGVFDRSSPLPSGGRLEQADGTAWMALYCLSMLEMALELAKDEPEFEDIAYKFYEHFIQIASAMDRMGPNDDELYDEGDGFYYDLLRLPDGFASRLKVRSLVGLLPICASLVITEAEFDLLPKFGERAAWLSRRYPEVICNVNNIDKLGVHGNRMLSVVTPEKLRRILSRMLDTKEFLGEHGIRSISRYHMDHPYVMTLGNGTHRVDYEPAESSTGMFGGNSNWRGPVWMPINFMLIYALFRWHSYLGDDFKVECPTGSGKFMNLQEVSYDLSRRLITIFTRVNGRRAVFGAAEKFQTDPHWRDLVLFYEYFHGDNGAGIGASHQTGWTGLVARLIQITSHGIFEFPDKPLPVVRESHADSVR